MVDSPPPLSDAPDRNASAVTMVELVTAAHTLDGTIMDTATLLQRMDICTCAAAEKHTRVQCVTVRMGDVVFESYPRLGNILELTARPVFTAGRTSLDIGLTVVALEGSSRTVVCEACFTYVTTKGPKGEKRMCPPLCSVPKNQHGGEQLEWERKIARHRKSLMAVENSNLLSYPSDIDGPDGDGFDVLELTEVVLPAHQNHMGHTFGGVVMAWMAKAALTCAMRLSTKSGTELLIRSIVRVDFQCGSDVSDHLMLRPIVNAVFDRGSSAEIEVSVYKRSITTGEETKMNIGYFFISGAGGKQERPFSSTPGTVSIQEGAVWRRRLLLARRQLLSGSGDVVEWHPALHNEAPMLTIASVLRLVQHNDSSVQWLRLDETLRSLGSLPSGVSEVEWTPGEAWGRNGTFVLRVKGILPGARVLEEVLDTLKSHRPGWDDVCVRVDSLEASNVHKDDSTSSLQWDVVRHVVLTPQAAIDARKQALGAKNGAATIPLCLLRTWQVDHAENTAIFASQSVLHSDEQRVAAQVRPSGWFLRGESDNSLGHSAACNAGVELTYIAEHDFGHLRHVCVGMSEEEIVLMIASTATQWFERLGGLMDC